MFPAVPDNLVWLEPWRKAVGREVEGLAQELRREVSVKHVLCGVGVLTVGRRIDCDDVLFVTDDPSKPLGGVHLTFSSHAEPAPDCPWTLIYDGWQDWVDRCMIPDHVNRFGEYLFEVKASFLIAGRGLIVAGDKGGGQDSPLFRAGAALMLLRPNLPPLATKIKGLEMLDPYRSDASVPVLLDGNLSKSDVPTGTEVWLVDAKPRS